MVKNNPVVIHRKRKKEAEQAIEDLVNRGFKVIYPLTKKTDEGIGRGKYNYKKSRYESIQAHVSSVWVAKLVRDAQ